MAVLSGAIRFRRYEVNGTPPADLRNVYEMRLRHHAFAGFGEAEGVDEVVGWVASDDWFDTDLYPDRWLIDNLIVLTLRTDVRKIPSLILRHECAKAEAERKQRDGRERLSRHEREEIKELVTRRLASQTLPAIRGSDVVWDLTKGEVLFFGTGEKANESFRILFEKTFEVKLRPLFPYALAVRGRTPAEAGKLEAAAAGAFAAPRRG